MTLRDVCCPSYATGSGVLTIRHSFPKKAPHQHPWRSAAVHHGTEVSRGVTRSFRCGESAPDTVQVVGLQRKRKAFQPNVAARADGSCAGNGLRGVWVRVKDSWIDVTTYARKSSRLLPPSTTIVQNPRLASRAYRTGVTRTKGLAGPVTPNENGRAAIARSWTEIGASDGAAWPDADKTFDPRSRTSTSTIMA